MDDAGPVPGRECGTCDACCVVFEIQVPSIAKPAGVPCRNLTKDGCAIYESRPDMCRKWLCGWRLIAGLPDNWRPDASGILIYQTACKEPGYGSAAMVISLSEGEAHLGDEAVLGFIHNTIAMRVPLYLTQQVSRIETPLLFLNDALGPCMKRNDRPGFVAGLARLMIPAN
jgi:hypothetical protein